MQQVRVRDVSGVLVVGKQIATHVTACRLVSVQPDKLRERILAGVELLFRQRCAQFGRTAQPGRLRVSPHALLRCVIVGQCKHLRLLIVQLVVAQQIEQHRRQVCYPERAAHHHFRHLKQCRNVGNALAFLGQQPERATFVRDMVSRSRFSISDAETASPSLTISTGTLKSLVILPCENSKSSAARRR